MVEAACVSVMSPVGRMSVPNSVAPMPTTIASTISLMPAEMTLPSTRSARNAVWPNKANGTSTKPASTVSLNSMMVMKSCTDSTKKANSTISHASISTTMVTKLVKNDVMPISSPAFSSSGREAVKPVDATNPGRIRSAAVSDAPDAFKPNPAKDWKTMSARPLKLFSSSAKNPTYRTFRISCATTLSSPINAQNNPASVISMATSTLVRNATSPASSPKPLSM